MSAPGFRALPHALGSPAGVDTYRHFFYNNQWQIVETRKTTTVGDDPEDLRPEYQYVWSRRYTHLPGWRHLPT